MSYRNQHQLHRSDQVWNRDIRHSDEEDYVPRSFASGYSPGYSSSNAPFAGYPPPGSDYGRSSRDRSHYRDYDDRYDGGRQDQPSEYRGQQYDYQSGQLRGHDRFGGYDQHSRFHSDAYTGYRNNGDHDRGWWDRSKDEVKSWFGDDNAERRRDNDRRIDHRGKGPKGYQRSEERIREDINDRLSDDDRVDASEIEVEVSGSEVVLKGTVATREEKRRAEDIAESISGVRNVENRLKCTNPQGGIDMSRYTGTTGDFTGIGSSSGTTSEIIRDVRNQQRRY